MFKEIRDSLRARIQEVSEKVLVTARLSAIGHIVFAALIAGGIALVAAQIDRAPFATMVFEFEDGKKNQYWYGVMVIAPLALTSLVSVLWHWRGAPWLEKISFRGWKLHTFYVPRVTDASIKMPAPETYLVIAATASAGALITLSDQSYFVRTLSSVVIGALTAATIVVANPRAGAIALSGGLSWQQDELYKKLLERKAAKQRKVLERQNWVCRQCPKETPTNLRGVEHRYALLDPDREMPGEIFAHEIKAVCKKCSLTLATTGESNSSSDSSNMNRSERRRNLGKHKKGGGGVSR